MARGRQGFQSEIKGPSPAHETAYKAPTGKTRDTNGGTGKKHVAAIVKSDRLIPMTDDEFKDF